MSNFIPTIISSNLGTFSDRRDSMCPFDNLDWRSDQGQIPLQALVHAI